MIRCHYPHYSLDMQLIPPAPTIVADTTTVGILSSAISGLEGAENDQYHFPDFTLLKNILSPWQYDTVYMAYQLWKRELQQQTRLPDYTFVVFPASKAYEGFLKDFLLKLELIDEPTYSSRRFRIGRAINPDVSPSQRDRFWLYDNIKHQCGEALAKQLWYTWLECRNHLFHYFPHSDQPLTLLQAREKLDQVTAAIQATLACWPQIK